MIKVDYRIFRGSSRNALNRVGPAEDLLVTPHSVEYPMGAL
jgi:hypothetical protein